MKNCLEIRSLEEMACLKILLMQPSLAKDAKQSSFLGGNPSKIFLLISILIS